MSSANHTSKDAPNDAQESQSLVTKEMIDAKGVWGPQTASFPVTESDVRRWAIAIYWPDTPPKLYWDAEYAASTRWGGIVAPQDFNPFAWPVERSGPASSGAMPGETPAKGQNVLNGGQTDTSLAPMRPGDVITRRTRLSRWEERSGRNGLTLFQYLETEWRNQDEEVVKRRMSTQVRY
jgi:hypothetical protein